MIEAGLASSLAEDGFAVVDLLPPAVATELRAAIVELDRRAASGLASANGDYGGGSFRHPDPAVRRSAMAAVEETFAPYVAGLLPGYRPILAGYIVKPAGAAELGMHQDWTMTSEPGRTVLNIWCPLIDVDAANGGLALVPGSHRIRHHVSGPGIAGYWGDYAERLKQLSPPLRLRAGQAVIYDNRTLHWATQNGSAAARPVATMTCIPDTAVAAIYLPEAASRGARLEVVDMSGDGYVAHGVADCLSGELARPRLAVIANPNRPIGWPEFEALSAGANSP